MMHPSHVDWCPGLATTELSQTLSGHTFSYEDHHLLCSIARARGWTSRIWVPIPVVRLLSLPLADDAFSPVRLSGSCGGILLYHSSQFLVPLSTLRSQWVAHQRHLQTVARDRETSLLAAQMEPDTLPLNTNGERFDSATEEAILQRVGNGGTVSRYWATAGEAAWLYRAPFTDAHISNPANGVISRANELCRPLTFYNVEGTADPTRFSPLTCRRYDPVNYKGRLYRPEVAVRMKAYSLQHNCLQEAQWITPRRAALLGLCQPPHIPALSLRSASILLINIGSTYRQRARASFMSHTEASDSVAITEDFLDARELDTHESLLIPLP